MNPVPSESMMGAMEPYPIRISPCDRRCLRVMLYRFPNLVVFNPMIAPPDPYPVLPVMIAAVVIDVSVARILIIENPPQGKFRHIAIFYCDIAPRNIEPPSRYGIVIIGIDLESIDCDIVAADRKSLAGDRFPCVPLVDDFVARASTGRLAHPFVVGATFDVPLVRA